MTRVLPCSPMLSEGKRGTEGQTCSLCAATPNWDSCFTGRQGQQYWDTSPSSGIAVTGGTKHNVGNTSLNTKYLQNILHTVLKKYIDRKYKIVILMKMDIRQ